MPPSEIPQPLPEPLIPARSQPLIAGLLACSLALAAAWMLLAGGFSGGLVDHDAPPQAPARFTVNINTATAVELAQLPGLGPALAQRIVDQRIEHGAFPSIEALLEVPGIGAITLSELRPHLRPHLQPRLRLRQPSGTTSSRPTSGAYCRWERSA